MIAAIVYLLVYLVLAYFTKNDVTAAVVAAIAGLLVVEERVSILETLFEDVIKDLKRMLEDTISQLRR